MTSFAIRHHTPPGRTPWTAIPRHLQSPDDTFPQDATGLLDAAAPAVAALRDGDLLPLRIGATSSVVSGNRRPGMGTTECDSAQACRQPASEVLFDRSGRGRRTHRDGP